MPAPVLTEDVAIEAIRSFFREKPFLFFGTGMSCALDNRFGMSALKDALIAQVPTHSLTPTQTTEWGLVVSALQQGTDLESALNPVNDQALLKTLAKVTGSFLAALDQEVAYCIAAGSTTWPATRLLKKLVDALPDNDSILHVLTPNYDLLFEYACDFAGVPYTNGLFGGIERREDWSAVDRAMREPRKVVQGRKATTVYKHRKHARLYKVHGSLNYFFHHNAVVENNAWMWCPPDYAERVMITPGLSKYQALQRYRQELLQYADSAIDKATHFLFLGYGFNDCHLEEYIKRKLIGQSSHGLILTRGSNERIEALLGQAENLWLVCATNGDAGEGTRIRNNRYPSPLVLLGQELWDVRDFTTRLFGD